MIVSRMGILHGVASGDIREGGSVILETGIKDDRH